MKRLSLLFVGLLSAVLLFSVVGVADEAAKVSATINFDEVLDLFIDGTLDDDINILQEGGTFSLRDAEDGTILSLGSVDVRVTSLVSFAVGASYYATKDGGDDEDQGLVSITGYSPIAFFDHTGESWSGDDYGADGTLVTGIDNFDDVTSITDDFSGEPNIGDPETVNYAVEVDLENLVNEYSNNEELDIDVAFWAFDANSV